jgi:hypothetical protein
VCELTWSFASRISNSTTSIELLKHSRLRRCILQEFMKLGVGMLPKMDNYTALDAVSLAPLMEGVHTKEAIEMVRCRGHALFALHA